jgi:simple sugar transport system permease protein
MKRKNALLASIGRIEGLPVVGVLLLLYAIFLITAPRVFTRPLIYMSFLQTVSPPLVLGLGLTLIITAGEIDLSFPAVVALSGFAFSWCFKNLQMPWSPWIGAVLALAAGALVGYINGVLVAKIHVPSIMATLATQFFWYGITILIAGGLQLNIKEIEETAIHALLTGRIPTPLIFGDTVFEIPAQAVWGLGLGVFLWFILNRHKFGEAVMFIGDNPDVARVMGINVELTKIKLFTLMGVIAAFAGLLLTVEINVFFPTQGGGYMLNTMAAVFIGGTLISGGLGSIVGTFFGSYVIGSLQAGVVATGVTSYWVQSVMGFIMAAAVAFNVMIGEGQIGRLSARIRHWIVPERLQASEASEAGDAPV